MLAWQIDISLRLLNVTVNMPALTTAKRGKQDWITIVFICPIILMFCTLTICSRKNYLVFDEERLITYLFVHIILVLWQWSPFVDDSCLLKSTMGRLSHRWRSLSCDLASKQSSRPRRTLDHIRSLFSNSLIPKIICLCQGEWLSSTRA